MGNGGQRSQEHGVEGLTHPFCKELVGAKGNEAWCVRPKGHHGEHSLASAPDDWIILPGPGSGIMDTSQMTPALQRAYQGYIKMHDRMNVLTTFITSRYGREMAAGLHVRFTDNIDAAIYYMGLERKTPRWMKWLFSIF